jgi:hypothetical protein
MGGPAQSYSRCIVIDLQSHCAIISHTTGIGAARARLDRLADYWIFART